MRGINIEKKTSKNILLIIMGMLILAELVVFLVTFMREPILSSTAIVVLVCVALYGFFLYKKPHGNLLKYGMLLYALSNASMTIWSIDRWNDPIQETILPLLVSATVFYCAGRLGRIDQNKYIFPIVEVALIIDFVISVVSFVEEGWPITATLHYSSHLIIFTVLMFAYFVRYKEHKEAGLADAPKTK